MTGSEQEVSPFTRRSKPYNYGIQFVSFEGDISLFQLSSADTNEIPAPIRNENANLDQTIGLLRSLEGVKCFTSSFDKDEIWPIVALISDVRRHKTTRIRSALLLTNLTSHKEGSVWLMNQNSEQGNIVYMMSDIALDPKSDVNTYALSILNNLSSNEECVDNVAIDFLVNEKRFSGSIDYLHASKIEPGVEGLPLLFANLCGSAIFRRKLLENGFNFLCNRLMLPSHSESTRFAVFSMMKNMVKDTELHDQLLKEEDILGNLMTGLLVTTDFKPEIRQKIPVSLQYLSGSRVPEPCWDIRLIAAEGVFQLCCKRSSREYLRNHGAYELLKEFYEWEQNETVKDQVLNTIEIIIKTEDEIGHDNFNDLDLSTLNKKSKDGSSTEIQEDPLRA